MDDEKINEVPARREYHKHYRQTHKEQIEENRRRYWERKAIKMAEAENQPIE